VDPLRQAVIWSAIPVALLLLATAVRAHAFMHRRPHQQVDHVERASGMLRPTRPAPPRSLCTVRPVICEENQDMISAATGAR
jgi:hypothetical protein